MYMIPLVVFRSRRIMGYRGGILEPKVGAQKEI
jgi:hypothetical protein